VKYLKGDGTWGIISGSTFGGGTVTGPTQFTNGLTANTISSTNYLNLPTDVSVTGGTYSNGTAILWSFGTTGITSTNIPVKSLCCYI
jgi:membrane-bound inhibitor of C-type lysozyme